MKVKFTFLVLIILTFIVNAYGLEIDEKLTCRILRLSSTKKTMLINRGLEDGVVVGDHAKFFVTTGVVARGVVIKASPSRTIWAIYRMVNPSEISVDSVVNLKVTAPVKLTHDSTKAFGRDRYDYMGSENPNIRDMGNNVDLGGRSGDVPMDLRRNNRGGSYGSGGYSNSRSDDRELQDMYASGNGGSSARSSRRSNKGSRNSMYMDDSGTDSSKEWEIWSLYTLSRLSYSAGESDSSATTTALDLYLGVEKYFNNPSAWFGKVSPVLFIHSASSSTSTDADSSVSSSLLELGIGAYYNFGASPFAYNKIIGFVGPTLAYGSTSQTAAASTGTSTAETETSGNVSTIMFGGGIKYYLPWGFGVRFVLKYMSRSESYEYEEGESETTKRSGFVTMAGLNYRF